MKELLRLSVFAGLLIGAGGLVYLHVGGVIGAVLFAFGLICVVVCKAQLYTGKAGFLPRNEQYRLLPMLVGNAIGCALVALLTLYATNELVGEHLDKILAARQAASWHGILVPSIGTGMLMTLAVLGMQRGTFLPLLFAVPLFILCGLPHCVADAFYYAAGIFRGSYDHGMWLSWVMAIAGNWIGCNLPRLFLQKSFTA